MFFISQLEKICIYILYLFCQCWKHVKNSVGRRLTRQIVVQADGPLPHWRQEPGALADDSHFVSPKTLVSQRSPVDISDMVDLEAGLPVERGGFGLIQLGRMKGELVAVKVLKVEALAGSSPRQRARLQRRLRREITVWARLKHPNILIFEGYVTNTDISEFPAMVSKWCRNGNAARYLEANPSIPLTKRISLGLDVANGLKYLHSLKIVHGDLKPENILISDEGIAQICDFGLVRLVDWQGRSGMTTTTPYSGTLRYKAYELFRSKSNRDPKPSFSSDVYALGCVLYEFAYMKQPFHGLELFELVDAIRAGAPPATRPQGLKTEEGHLWDLFEQCWKPEPPERTTAEAVVCWLHTIISKA